MLVTPSQQQIEKWVTALRSGKYQQAKSSAQIKGTHCALGVACQEFISEFEIQLSPSGEIMSNIQNAPQWIKTMDTLFLTKAGRWLSNLNDVDELSFDEIADCLEAVFVHKVMD